MKTRTRTCTSPPPTGAGKDFSGLGPAEETEACNTQECRKMSINISDCVLYKIFQKLYKHVV